MMLFWLICAALVAIALAFVLPPLLAQVAGGAADDGKTEANLDVYRDQLSELEADLRNGIISREQYQQDRDSIERRLLEDVPATEKLPARQAKQAVINRGPVYAIALAIPAVALILYLQIGNRGALSGVATASPANAAQGNGQMNAEAIAANVAALAKRLEQNPSDAEGWAMLGRSYLSMEKFGDATNAYAKAAALKTDDPDLLGEYAFAMAMANGRQLQGQPLELIKKALQLDPKNARALNLAGSAEYQAKNFKGAIEYWQQELAVTPAADADTRARVTQMIDEAKAAASPGAGARPGGP